MDPDYLPFCANPTKPTFQAPLGSVDAHCHVVPRLGTTSGGEDPRLTLRFCQYHVGDAHCFRRESDGAVASWTVETWGPNWRVTTDFHWFRWDDFVVADGAVSDWWRFPLGVAALMEFILTGTVMRCILFRVLPSTQDKDLAAEADA